MAYVLECQNHEYGEWVVGPFGSYDEACRAMNRMEAPGGTSAELVALESWADQQSWLEEVEREWNR